MEMGQKNSDLKLFLFTNALVSCFKSAKSGGYRKKSYRDDRPEQRTVH